MRGAHKKDPKRFGPEPVESETARSGFPRTCVARRGTAADAMTEPDFDRPDLADRLLRKAETAIRARTSRILCVIERCTDEHNYSAVIRSCEALGVQHIWLVDPVEVSYEGVDDGLVDDDDDGGDDDGADADRARERAGGLLKSHGHGSAWREAHKLFARRANEFTTIREFPTTRACVEALREAGYVIWATDLSQKAICMTHDALRDAGFGDPDDPTATVVPEKLAIVFGTESVGCTREILESADARVYLPLRGFADSLNLSVAAALCIQTLFYLCPEAVGAMSDAERAELREKWFTQLAANRVTTRGQDRDLRDARTRLTRVRKKLLRAETAETGLGLGLGFRVETAETETRADPNPNGVGGRVADLVRQETILRDTIDAMEETRRVAANGAIQPYLANPPAPLRDMRRPDEHREAYVGKGVRAKNAEHWAGMPAVRNHASVRNHTKRMFEGVTGEP